MNTIRSDVRITQMIVNQIQSDTNSLKTTVTRIRHDLVKLAGSLKLLTDRTSMIHIEVHSQWEVSNVYGNKLKTVESQLGGG